MRNTIKSTSEFKFEELSGGLVVSLVSYWECSGINKNTVDDNKRTKEQTDRRTILHQGSLVPRSDKISSDQSVSPVSGLQR